jgi:tetratricopeptide (TPR) repeat protein
MSDSSLPQSFKDKVVKKAILESENLTSQQDVNILIQSTAEATGLAPHDVKKIICEEKNEEHAKKKKYFLGVSLIIIGLSTLSFFLPEKNEQVVIKSTKKEVNLEKIEISDIYRTGKKLYDQKKFSEALPYLLIQSKESETDHLIFAIARSYYHTGNYQEALTWFNRSRIKFSTDHHSWYIGRCYLFLKKYDIAIHELKKAIRHEPNNYTSYYQIGKAYYLNNDRNNATEHFNKSISLHPDIKVSIDKFLSMTP